VNSVRAIALETRRRLGESPYWRRPVALRCWQTTEQIALRGDVGEPLVIEFDERALHDSGTLEQLVTRYVWPKVIDILGMD